MNGSPLDAADLRCGRVLVAVALLSGIGLMWPLWTGGPLVLDEHCSYWIVDAETPGTIYSRSLSHAATPPLSSWLQWLSLSLLGKSEVAFRLPSALCYLGAIGVTFLVGAALDRPMTGGLAALFVAWHPEALTEVRLARPYGLLLLLSALLLWGAARWWQAPASRTGPVTVGLSAAALLWTHYVAALLVATVGAVLFVSRGPGIAATRASQKHVVMAGLMIVLASLPLWPAVLRIAEWSPYLNYQRQSPKLTEFIGPIWWIGIPVGLVLSAVAGRRGAKTGTTRTRLIFITAAWGLLPLLALTVAARGDLTSLANPRYRVPFVVAGSYCIAQLIQWRAPPRSWAATACVLVIGAAWWFGGASPWGPGRLSDPLADEWQALAERIERDGRAGEPVFVQGGLVEASLIPLLYEDEAFVEYVGCRASRFYLESPHPRIGLPFLWDEQSGVQDYYRERMREIPESGQDSFWLACALDTDLNRNSCDGMQVIASQEGYEVVAELEYAQTILRRYRLIRERR
jgi:hypothetical protein